MYHRDGLSLRGPVQRYPPIRVEDDMKQIDPVLTDIVLTDTVLIDTVPIDTVLIDTAQSDEEVMSEAAEAISQQSPVTVTPREGGEVDPGPQAENQPTKRHLILFQRSPRELKEKP